MRNVVLRQLIHQRGPVPNQRPQSEYKDKQMLIFNTFDIINLIEKI